MKIKIPVPQLNFSFISCILFLCIQLFFETTLLVHPRFNKKPPLRTLSPLTYSLTHPTTNPQILTFSHSQILTFSHFQIFKFSNSHIFKFSHPQILTSSHFQIFKFSHPHIFNHLSLYPTHQGLQKSI
jgi:hypothetical protein